MTPLQKILAAYRATSQTEREKGTYFEELIRTYFRNEPRFVDLYSDVWLYTDWAKEIGGPQFHLSAKDTGIDLVAKTAGTEEFHAIQCKCYAEDYRVRKADIDSFFTASGQKPFVQRIIVTTDKDSGITSDANLWATETMGDAKYPLELFLRVITVSLETNRIVAGLPGLEIDSK
ncbi:MAG: restriction endonuclease [Akkermansiaceae bacterium]|jgi:predicted helicase|nr:restriction endonuclease [Akkermansiaceae bacterium]